MFKTIVTGATALTLLAGAAAYAQQPPGAPDFVRRTPLSQEDRAAFLDARIAGLHAGLRLTPEQAKTWPAFEQAYRDLAATRRDRVEALRGDQPADPVQSARRRAEALAARSVALTRYADAAGPLYQSLDEGQKRRFGILSHAERPFFFRRFAFLRDEGDGRGDFRAPR
jgi:LTXXQ motif family protein